MGSQPRRSTVAGTHCRKAYGNHQSIDADGNILLPVICDCGKMVFVTQKDVFNGRTVPCPKTRIGRPRKVAS